MKRTPLPLLLALATTVTSSCIEGVVPCPNGSSDDFPQYSGKYILQSVDYEPRACSDYAKGSQAYEQCKDEHSLIKKQPPAALELTHRMEWDENQWNQRLRIESADPSKTAARGAFNADLPTLANIEPGCVPGGTCSFSGVDFKHPKGPNSVEVAEISIGCEFRGYYYRVHAALTPDPALLKKIYWSNDPAMKGATGFEHVQGYDKEQSPMTMTDPDNACVEPKYVDKWKQSVAGAQGVSLVLTLSKKVDANYGHCAGKIYPPADKDQDKGEITLVYKLAAESVTYKADLRIEGLGDTESDTLGDGNLFENIAAFE